jgi:hypothetical protein
MTPPDLGMGGSWSSESCSDVNEALTSRQRQRRGRQFETEARPRQRQFFRGKALVPRGKALAFQGKAQFLRSMAKLDIVARGPGIMSPPARRRPQLLSRGYLCMAFGQNRLVSKNFRVWGIEKHDFFRFLQISWLFLPLFQVV